MSVAAECSAVWNNKALMKPPARSLREPLAREPRRIKVKSLFVHTGSVFVAHRLVSAPTDSNPAFTLSSKCFLSLLLASKLPKYGERVCDGHCTEPNTETQTR